MVSQLPNIHQSVLFRATISFNKTWRPILWKTHLIPQLTAPPCMFFYEQLDQSGPCIGIITSVYKVRFTIIQNVPSEMNVIIFEKFKFLTKPHMIIWHVLNFTVIKNYCVFETSIFNQLLACSEGAAIRFHTLLRGGPSRFERLYSCFLSSVDRLSTLAPPHGTQIWEHPPAHRSELLSQMLLFRSLFLQSINLPSWDITFPVETGDIGRPNGPKLLMGWEAAGPPPQRWKRGLAERGRSGKICSERKDKKETTV
jgi:hypothetical protein